MPRSGDVIIINGSSSAGKSTIAGKLQRLSSEPFLHSGIDHFLHRMPEGVFVDPLWVQMEQDSDGRLLGVTLGPQARLFFAATYRAVAEFAWAGFSVIVDDVMYDREVVAAAVETLAPLRPLVVGVRCPLEVARARERQRGDRILGGAEVFHISAHALAEYDLEVDSSLLDPQQTAAAILAARQRPRLAFTRMRSRLT